MRPTILNPLFASLTSLPGVGPKLERLYRRLLGREEPHVIDLLLHLPSGVVDRRAQPKLAEVVPGTMVTVAVTIEQHRPSPPHRSRAPYRIFTSDETGTLTLTFFHARADQLQKQMPEGSRRYVSGTAEFYDGELQMVHPDRVVDEDGFATLPLVEPVYPLTEGLAAGNVRRTMQGAMQRIPALPEWQDETWLVRERFPPFAEALRALHQPDDPSGILPDSIAWKRLAYDELLAGQLALALVRAHMRKQSGRGSASEGVLRQKVIDALPYSLTPSQARAVDDIVNDLALPRRMLRLLQGDVGSGKTVVALVAAATVIEAGRQAAIMAPTEILARQHYSTIAPLAAAAGLRIAILTGRDRGKDRREMLERLAIGDIDLVVGTHALFQDDVAFKDLALAIVDEQHRFGVHQRLALADKGRGADLLVMTATPIPRTLVLTHFGDMDVSILAEKPAGRQPIDTAVLPISEYGRVVSRLKARIAEGAQAFWVCPLVEESETLDVVAAEDRFAELKKVFGDEVALVHGRMSASQKQAVMDRFVAGDTKVLVATTVIEVGVNVPRATIMII
ncbi:MAG TPA: ATP-dependent DNA helicase RecG, partial [Pseudolabrys sp.]|nr:ATP-dependent DNA helicase RecG [Pseudolabrys sp.]